MQSILEFITLGHRIEHDLKHKRQFSTPKIYNGNGDLNKRWYVYYSFRNPKSGKLERQKNIYGVTNSHKTFEERMFVLGCYARNLTKLLKQGYNPYVDNTELYHRLQQEDTEQFNGNQKLNQSVNNDSVATAVSNVENIGDKDSEPQLTVESALDYALNIKKQVISQRTHSDYTYKKEALVEWLKNTEPPVIHLEELSKKHLNQFLNDVLSRSSARNRNNYRIDLSSLFQTLKDNDIVQENFFREIPPLRSIPVRNRGFSLKQQKKIFGYLKKRDPLLLLYIKFISYVFLRPIEVCRIRVKDIDVINKRISFKAKNNPHKTKILPQLLIDVLPDISKLPQENLLFSKDGLGLEWDAKLGSRRDYFSKRFKDVVKDNLGFDENYGLYSFRHTYITKLYNELLKDHAPFAAKTELMLITGHTTMTALEKYLRTIDAEMPADYSDML